MTDEVFKWVIAVAVLIVFISNLIVLWLMYGMLKPLVAKLQTTSDRINPILSEAQGIMSHTKDMVADAKPIVAEAQPLVRSILAKTNDGIEPILSETQGILGNAKSISGTISDIVKDAQPSVRNVATKTSDITDIVYTQATEIRALMHDTVLPTAKNQVERVDDLVKRTTDKIDATTAALEEKLIEPVTRTSGDITNMLYEQVNEISTLIQDTVLKVRNQVEQLDDLVRRTGGTVDSSITNLERRVTNPVREVNYMEAAIRKGLSVLFNKNKQ